MWDSRLRPSSGAQLRDDVAHTLLSAKYLSGEIALLSESDRIL
jgi:hypothetical protein